MNNPYISKVTGPVIPLPVPFKEDQSVDLNSLSNYVKFLADNGIPNVMTTVGTSRYNLLTWDEMKAVNETVVNAAAGKINTIVANPTTGGVHAAIDFGKHAQSIGADFYLVYFPERHYGDDNTYAFFKEITDHVSTPILIHEMPMRNGMGPGTVQYSIDLLHRLLDIETIVGLKEEALDPEYSNEVLKAVVDKSVIIGAGGGMSRYLQRDYALGAKAFLGGIGNCVPSLELEFFEAITGGNQSRAEEIVNDIELPLFADTVPIGWHPSLKGMLSIMGLLPKYERKPMKQLSEDEMAHLKAALARNQWI
jgi:dihydrodipicolinate synthase/N-acetylneuraminate lyase